MRVPENLTVLSPVEFKSHSAGINAVPGLGLGQAAVPAIVVTPEIVVTGITDIVTDFG